jgi:eukaryotic-like serine/threonine-protein kinase
MQKPMPPTEALSEILPPDALAAPDNASQRTLAPGVDANTPLPSILPTVPGYHILQALGRGGMGVVYKARQIGLNRLVALKMLLGGHLASQEARLRFLFEAEIVARVRHPHIVEIYEVGTYQEQPYLALEFVDGGCLADKLGEPHPARSAARLIELLARAIHVAHLQGIIHRDLKPANILLATNSPGTTQSSASNDPFDPLLAPFGIPKITDFGLAKLVQGGADLTQTGAVLGTPHYMAPEQADTRHQTVGPGTDLFSLGAMLFELLTGRPPFKEDTSVSTIMKLTNEEAPRVQQFRPELATDLATICHKCLEKQPDRRYASAEALADDLARFLRDEPIQARPVSAWERGWRWCRRNPTIATLAGSVAILLVAAVATFLWVAQERAARAEQRTKEVQDRAARQAQTAQAVNRNLDEARLLQAKAERDRNDPFTWKLALTAAKRAENLLGDDDPDLRRRVQETVRDLEQKEHQARERRRQEDLDQWMIGRLEELRVQMSVGRRGERFQWQVIGDGFAEAFRKYGTDPVALDLETAAKQLKQHPPAVIQALAVGLDYWVYAEFSSAWEDSEGETTESQTSFPMQKLLSMPLKVQTWRKLLTLAKTIDSDPLRGKMRDAIGNFKIAEFSRLARSPEFLEQPPATQAMAAQILTKIDKPDVVFALLHAAHRRRPDDYWLNFRLANYYLHLKDTPDRREALRFATAALALRPEDQVTRQIYATALLHAGQHAEALPLLRQCLERQSDNPLMLFELGYALAHADQHAEAEKCYRRVIQLRPNHVVARNNLGVALENQGKPDAAEAEYREAVRITPSHYLPRRNLARVLAARGQRDEAIQHYREVLRLRPNDAASKQALKQLETEKKK